MKKSLGKRLISGVTSGLLAVMYSVPANLGISASAENANDGLPIIDTPFEETMWYTGNPLGVAGDFHLFAFDTIETMNNSAHINGNIAAPNYLIGANHGALNTQGTGRLLNVVRDSFKFKEGADYDTVAKESGSHGFSLGNMSDFMFPADCKLSIGYPEGDLTYPQETSSAVKLRMPNTDYVVEIYTGGVGKSESYIAHTGKNLIDFEKEKANYQARSKNYAGLGDSYAKLEWQEFDANNDGDPSNDPKKGVLTLNKEGTNVLNITADGLDEYRGLVVKDINFDGEKFYDNQVLVVNIDLQGRSKLSWTPEWTYRSVNDPDTAIGIKEEDSALHGTNIIYNFYNAAPDGTQIIYNEGETWSEDVIGTGGSAEPWGCVLAPDCEVVPNNMSGTIIAQNIRLHNETHMSSFMNSVSVTDTINVSAKKTWSDGNEKHDGDEVKVSLYRSEKGGLVNVSADENAQKLETETLNKANDWKTEWKGLKKNDESGKTYFYYAVEEEVPADYEVSYIGNGASVGSKEIGIVNTAKAVPSKLKFVKFNDTIKITSETDSSIKTESSKKKQEGAKFTLTAKETAGAKLNEGVTSNLDSSGTEGTPIYSADSITWTTIPTDIEFTNLPNGIYVLSETAPRGYQSIDDIEFRFDSGKITILTENKDITATSTGERSAEIDVVNELFTFAINKVDENGDPLIGARLRLEGTTESGSAVNMTNVKARSPKYYTADGRGWDEGEDLENYITKEGNRTSFEWVSTGSEIIFTGLPEGDYTVEEVSAPAGYALSGEKVKFTISRKDGKLEADKKSLTITNKKIDSSVKISKADVGGEIVEGAEFTLVKNDGDKLVQVITDYSADDVKAMTSMTMPLEINGKNLTVNDVTDGMGYTLSGPTFRNVTVDGNAVSDEQNVFTTTGKASGTKLTVAGIRGGAYKLELEDGRVFNIVADADEAAAPKVTAFKAEKLSEYKFKGGAAEITGLEDGEYVLKETASPNGYTKVDSEFTFTVKDGAVDKSSVKSETTGAIKVADDGTLIITDNVSEITVDKYFDADGNTTPSGTTEGADMKLTFKKASDKPATVIKDADTLAEGKSAEWNTKTTPFKTFKGLMDGEYVLEEVNAPKVYEKAASKTFTIEDGVIKGDTTNKVSLLNVKKNTIVLDKQALGGTPIPESAGKAKFTLIAGEGSDLSGVSINDGDVLGEGVKTSEFDGNVATFMGLKDGTYTLREDTAPTGYSVVSDFTFTVKAGKVTDVSSVTTGRAYVDENGKLVVEDAPILNISKTDLGGKEITDGAAEFTLTAKDTDGSLAGVKINGGEALGSVKSAAFTGNTTKIEYLKDGKYSLKEDTAPAGYSTVSEFTFTVKNGLVTEVSAVTDGVTELSKDGTTVTVKDAPIIKLNKTDLGGTPIPETAGKVEYQLTAKDSTLEGVKINGGDALKSTDKSAKIVGNISTLEHLKDGKYTLTETVAPDGYTVVSTFDFTVKNGVVTDVTAVTTGNVTKSEDGKTITVADDVSKITIDKKALGAEEIPASAGKATFVLTAEDEGKTLEGVTVGDKKLTKDDKSTTFTGNSTKFTGLKDGKYSLEETVAPDGYVTVTKFTFDIENGAVKNVETVTDGNAYVDDKGNLVVEDKQSEITIDKKALGAEEIPASAGKA
ncbi:SpaA isopeptide-forming pilin-related protein, partial [Ruminococcus flavefaciens]|uniref:SpaA isopeptide-forming pilin-related protein n=1 Tax=Ruminococcus flavefaciens TaxID=1265 RepID=UPI0026E98667